MAYQSIFGNTLPQKTVPTPATDTLDTLKQGTAAYLPQAIKETAIGFGKGVLDFGKSILQAPQRTVTSVALEPAAGILSLIKGEKVEPVFTPTTNFQKMVLGDEPIKGVFKNVSEAQKTSEKVLQKAGVEKNVSTGASMALAPLLVGGMKALDLTPVGGTEKALVKTLAKETNEKIVANTLKKIGVADNVAASYAGKIAKETDENKISAIVKQLSENKSTTGKMVDSISTIKSSPITKETKKVIGPKERGFVTSVKEKLPNITKVSGQYIPRSTDELAIKSKNLIKDNVEKAEEVAMRTDDIGIAVSSELLKHYDDLAREATDQTVKDVLYQKAADLANIKAEQLTELGRSIQAASILGRLTPEGQLRFAAREIQKYNKVNPGKKIPELTGEQSGKILKEMGEINKLPDGAEKSMRFQKLQREISDLVPTSLFKKIITVWKAGLLTGVKTSGLNIMANLYHLVSETASQIPATMVDKIVSIFTKARAKTISFKGTGTGASEGIKKGWRYLTTGYDERDIGTKLDYKHVNFGKGKIAQALQLYTDSVFRLIGSEDQPVYYAAKLRSLYEQAKVAAINKKLKGQVAQKFIDELIQNPTEQMVKYATTDAEAMVFQNKTKIGEALSSMQRKLPISQIALPFSRTPSAVMMRVLDYTPVGIAKTIFENVGKGRFDQRLFSEGIGRGLTGIALLALGAEMAKKGMINTSRPTTEKEQKLWELEGRMPNSIYDPVSKKWRQSMVFGPAGNVLLIGASFQKAFENSGSPSEAASTGLAEASRAFTQQTFLTGINNFIDALSDPARSAKSVVGSTLASTIPTIISDVGRAIDTKERRANEIFEKFMARIPGVRQTLEPQIDVLGRERKSVGNPIEILIDPTRPSPMSSEPLIKEFRRLWNKGVKSSPTLLGDKNGYKGLSKEQNTELWKKAGEISNSKLNNLITKDAYKKLDDEKKGKVIEEIVDKAKLMARVSMVIEVTGGLKGEELKIKLKELKDGGLLSKEVFDKWKELR